MHGTVSERQVSWSMYPCPYPVHSDPKFGFFCLQKTFLHDHSLTKRTISPVVLIKCDETLLDKD